MSKVLRDLYARPAPVATREVVKWTDPVSGKVLEIALEAANDAEIVLQTMILDDGKKNAYALAYSSVLAARGIKDPVSPETVPFIKLVHRSIVKEEGDYLDESAVAFIAKAYGDLFFLLLEAATRIGNLGGIGESFLEAKAGNSSAVSTQEGLPSTSGRSGRRAKPRPR